MTVTDPIVADLGIADRYRSAVDSFVALARTLTDDEWSTPVPCCPGWTCRDVLSHVSGIPDDALHGRLDGVATEPWTASQVERNAAFTVDELHERWRSQYETFAAAIETMDQSRPPCDSCSHEHDVRHAIGRPGDRADPMTRIAMREIVDGLGEVPVELTVETTDIGALRSGGAGPTVTLRNVTGFDVFRSRLGRRSRTQVTSWDWSGDADAIATTLDHWFGFGPSENDVDE